MPRQNLKGSSQKRAANRVSEKVARKTTPHTDTPPVPSTTIAPTTNGHKSVSNSNSAVTVPDLASFEPSQISGMMPQFDENAFHIADPLNPPETLPQVSESHFEKSQGIHQGTIRALKLWGLGYDVADTKFTVMGKRAKAFGSGIRAATAVERVKGDYLDYQSQKETTEQKSVAFSTNQVKTSSDRTISTYTQATLDERVKQAEADAEMARQKTTEKQNQLDEFKKSLGHYLPATK